MEITVRNYEKKDEVQLKKLMIICSEEHLLNLVDSSDLKLAVTVFVENLFVGCMIVWTNKFHPHCTYFKILIHPQYFETEIAEKLLSKLDELEGIKLPLQTSIWESAINLKILYEKKGFKEIRRTFLTKLLTADFKVHILINENLRIKSLQEIVTNELLFENLTGLVKRNYQQAHLVNPVADKELSVWKKFILSEDIDLIGSYVLLNNEESDILAYSFFYILEELDTMEFGWCGADEYQNVKSIQQLIRKQLQYAVQHNIKSIVGEFDTTDFYAMEIFRHFQMPLSKTLITYQTRSI